MIIVNINNENSPLCGYAYKETYDPSKFLKFLKTGKEPEYYELQDNELLISIFYNGDGNNVVYISRKNETIELHPNDDMSCPGANIETIFAPDFWEDRFSENKKVDFDSFDLIMYEYL